MRTNGASGIGALSFELENDLAEMPTLADHLEAFCAQHGISPEVAALVNLALEEIVTNIVAMGYADEGDHHIRVHLAHDGDSITARVEDDAEAFEPLGIHLVRTLMDEVTYSREQDQNVLLIRKATS
ncbi:MAG: ATP-binding protein [Vicinamibacterales bacterium]